MNNSGEQKLKPTVYLICGFIGAGKSTFSKKLEQRTGAVRITKDEWLIKLFGYDPRIEGYSHYDHVICELSRKIAYDFAKHGTDVIIDEGFWAKSERDEMKARAEEVGAKCVLYYVECPIDVARKRVVGRNQNLTKDSFQINNEMFDGYLKHWEPPKKDEDYLLAE